MTKQLAETAKAAGVNKVKLAIDVAIPFVVAMAPALITAATCAIIVKKMEKN